MIKFSIVVGHKPYDCYFAERPEDNAQAIEHLANSPKLAVDTETSGLYPFFNPDFRIRLVQLFNGREVWLFRPEVSYSTIKDILSFASTVAMFNAPFDVAALYREGLIDWDTFWPKVIDVRSVAHLIDNRGRKGGCPLDLKTLGHYLVENWTLSGSIYNKDKTEKKLMIEAASKAAGRRIKKDEMWSLVPIDDENLLKYSARDAIWTGRLMAALMPIIQENGYTNLLKREQRLAYICASMERRGFSVDTDYVRKLEVQLNEDIAELIADMDAKYELAKPGSAKQIGVAFQKLGIELPKTEKGNFITQAEELRKINHPLAAALLDYKEETKILGNTINPLLQCLDSDNRVHCNYRTLGTITARMSANKPNLQQMPKKKDTVRKLRSCLQADYGKVVVSADLAGIEYRVAADLSQDVYMIDAFQKNQDLHEEAAKIIFNIDRPTKEQRDLAKSAGFGKIYGAGAAKIAHSSGTSIHAAEELIRKYDDSFSGLSSWSQAQIEMAKEQIESGIEPQLTTIYGRRLYLDVERPYVAVNYQIQSAARDILVDWMFKADDAGLLDGLLAVVHDELVLQTAPEDAIEVANILEKLATEVDVLSHVPIVAESKTGSRSWGSLKTNEKVRDSDRMDVET